MSTLAAFFEIDTTPLPSDFDTLEELQLDISAWMREHPQCVVFRADDPGYNRTPRKAPRLGWCAYNPADETERREWTITLANVKNSRKRKD